ncbi:MAG: hypothetical protein WA109_11320 [Bellilinea sp.]
MTVRRVFVIWTHPLFHETARLLLKHPDVIWVGAAQDISIVHEEILKLQPDTILFERTVAGFPADLIEIIQAETWDVRMIGLSLEDNKINLFQREHQTVVEAGDLLQFVLG